MNAEVEGGEAAIGVVLGGEAAAEGGEEGAGGGAGGGGVEQLQQGLERAVGGVAGGLAPAEEAVHVAGQCSAARRLHRINRRRSSP